MPITSTGIGSGLDVEGLVSQLVLAEIGPYESRLNRSEAQFQARISAYGAIKSSLATFQEKVANAALSGQFLKNTATTTSPQSVGAVAENYAEEGEYLLEVSSLASAQALASGAFAESTSSVGTGRLNISLGALSYDEGSGSVTAFSPKAGSATLSLVIDSSNNSLIGIRDTINSSNAGISASVLNDGSGYRLVLRSEATGLENGFTVSVEDTGDGDSIDSSGLSQLTFDSSSSNLLRTLPAGNALLRINGLDISSESNDVSKAVEGVTFRLAGLTTQPVSVSVSKDLESPIGVVRQFVEGYNALKSELDAYTRLDPSGSAAGALAGDSTLRLLALRIRSSLNSAVGGVVGSYATLAELGITTDAVSGKLKINEARLNEILAQDPRDVARVLTNFGTPDNSSVRYISSTAQTKAGSYTVQGVPTSTAGYLTASGPITQTSYNGSGNQASFSISVDGAADVDIILSNNDQTNEQVLDRINTALAGSGAMASLSNNVLTFTSDSSGASSSIEITQANAAAIQGLGVAVGSGVPGTSMTSYTINGEPALLTGDLITGKTGTEAEGLALKIIGNASGDLGTVVFSEGIANPLANLVSGLLAEDGLIDARLDGLEGSVANISNQRDSLELRAEALEKRYRLQFSGLETLIAQLNTTQTFLSQALSGFVEPNTTLRK